ncbi:MAG: SPASM domain-containing protein [Eubacteriales bacterium]|nr:SPASM domain-containing protein [Eubacteriales bacterium]
MDIDTLSYSLLNKICTSFHKDYQLPASPQKRRSGTLAENIFINWEDEFVWPSLKNPFVSLEGTCRGARDMLAVLCDGTVVPCCLDSDGIISFGNLFENSMQDILDCQRFNDMQNGLRSRKLLEELCQKCSYRNRFHKS